MNKEQDKPSNNVATTNMPASPGMPLLNLSMTDKVYLAVSRESKNKMHYVYSLFCCRVSGSQYNLMPESEIATFKNKSRADIYYNTLCQIQEFQSRGDGYQAMRDFGDKYIKAFNEKSR